MKICLQAGHKGRTSGATGAPGERDWTTKIVPMIAERLRKNDIEVYETDAFADGDTKVTSTDWDLFLAIHYDADIYNDSGGFVDYANPDTDMATERSQYIANKLSEYYFSVTGIKDMPKRSNANTRNYYMWQALTADTPCVIIECGVGNRKPEDYEILRNYDLISSTIAEGIRIALGVKNPCETKIEALEKELDDMRDSRNSWRTKAKSVEALYLKETAELTAHRDMLISDLKTANERIEALEKAVTDNKTPLSYYTVKERLVSILETLFKGEK